jgi:hypothetical protein
LRTGGFIPKPPEIAAFRSDPIVMFYAGIRLVEAGRSEGALNVLEPLVVFGSGIFALLVACDPRLADLLPAPASSEKPPRFELSWEYFHRTSGKQSDGGWNLQTNTSVQGLIPITECMRQCVLRMKGTKALDIYPEALILLDGEPTARFTVNSEAWSDYLLPIERAPTGPHLLEVRFTNDYYYPKDGSDRDLYFQSCTLVDTNGVTP